MTNTVLTDEALDIIFRAAHTATAWKDLKIEGELLENIYNIMKFGPTSANASPLRIVFVKTEEAKEKLKPCLAPNNVYKTMAAPVTAIFAYDTEFYEHLPRLFPHTDAKSWFVGNDTLIKDTAFRNSSLQAAYFIVAARAMGLDCGPMSGFDAEKLNAVFFPDGKLKTNFICNLGYAEPSGPHARNPRFEFGEVCDIQ